MSGLVDLFALTYGGPGSDGDGDRLVARVHVDPRLVALAAVRVIVKVDRIDRAQLSRVLRKLAAFVARPDNPVGEELKAAGQDDWGFEPEAGWHELTGYRADPAWPGRGVAEARSTGEAAERWLQNGAPERPDDRPL